LAAPQAIVELVERFDRNIESYRSGQYNETQLRREFIDPLFKALGWDVDNEKGYAEAYKDVVHEDAIKVGASTKAPDYCFRIGGTRKFFVEAKKPSVNLKDDISPAFQLRRYSWSAKLPLGILTDFEELAVYDGRVQPVKNDKASKARVKYFTYKEYVDRWDEIATIFSREEVLRGSFDKYVESSKAKRGTAEVDTAFLKEIEAWRDMLARNIALRNPDLTTRELNFAVQRTIDRIVFLRICEDRGIEKYGWLQSLLDGQRVYPRLCEFFRRADERYNSGLFHFSEDSARQEPPDELTLSLEIDDKILKDIIRDLYYPDSPYEFSVLPPEILGQVYEQFLGKVISLSPGHRAKVEYKPEVRKAGGVYYTPSYIVKYIVENTVGKLLEGQTPTTASELRVLDPACGSGSFLIGAYQRLLDWHRDWYVDKLVPLMEAGQNAASKEVQALLPEGYTAPKRGGKKRNQSNGNHFPIFQAQGGEWKLTTEERKRILLNNIYGVDIDPQAVEVTKLSLHLKVLEGESEETLSKQLKLFQERALPDLGENIKCGNSLIGWDILEAHPDLSEEEIERVNPFDWDGEFPEIMGRGGFDAVIGNPPYISIQAMKQWAPVEVDFYKERYKAAKKGNYDIYLVFVERALNLLSSKGKMGYILPNKFFVTDYGEELRNIITNRNALERIVDFGYEQVFEKATTYTCLLLLSGSPLTSFRYVRVSPSPQSLIADLESDTYPSNLISGGTWQFMSELETNLFNKIGMEGVPLLELPATISRGSSSGNDKIFMLKRTLLPNKYITFDGEEVEIEDNILRVPVFATDFTRYNFTPKNEKVIIFPYFRRKKNFDLLPEIEFKKNFPLAFNYLYSRKKELEQRKQYRAWYGFSAPRNLSVHENAQMIVPLLANKGLLADLPENREDYCLMASGGFSITITENKHLLPRYVLGILNSKLLFWYLEFISNRFRGGWITCTKQYVGKLPIRTIDFSDPQDVARHDKMVSLVERMLDLHKRLAETKAGHEKTLLQRQIEATDKQIDRLVYELYGLTEEEIKIVEEATA
jgi:hypothetical protein